MVIPRTDSKRISMPAAKREFCGFRIVVSVFRDGQPDWENSKLVKALTVQKVTSRNPGHSAGAHWHGYSKPPILYPRLQIFSLCALPCPFYLPDSFAKPPP